MTTPQGLTVQQADGLVVDTARVPPEDRFSYWKSATSQVLGPLLIQRRTRRSFSGRIFSYSLGPLTLGRTLGDPSSISGGRETVGPASQGDFLLIVHEAGRCVVETAGPEAHLAPGDLVLSDWSVPTRIDCEGDEPFTNTLVTIPRWLLSPYQDRLSCYVGRPVRGSAGAGRLLSRFVLELGHALTRGELVADSSRLAESTLDLALALFLAGTRPEVPPVSAKRSMLMIQVKRYIEGRLGDPRLNPESIAEAHFISVRLLYKLFEAEGRSVAEWVRERRIQCCRRDLIDPSLAGMRITDIATRWGFTSSTHFSRAFRDSVGCSPREFR
ncbi:helix-turn-helix domain-containing protein, partial [Streptomyces sp. NPDC007162]|uniref:helix-turn-helix domain-containing protein n=1 Tax=Streptomyces sp. NPDC007162 TaxID=3156917 RepID=UPI0033DB4820